MEYFPLHPLRPHRPLHDASIAIFFVSTTVPGVPGKSEEVRLTSQPLTMGRPDQRMGLTSWQVSFEFTVEVVSVAAGEELLPILPQIRIPGRMFHAVSCTGVKFAEKSDKRTVSNLLWCCLEYGASW